MTQGQALAASERVLEQLRSALNNEPSKQAFQTFVRILRRSFDWYNWVGIYLVKEDRLVLEAYAGDVETEHVSIPIGQGICGFAARTGETVVVPDISRDPRYLMCFPSTRSEIVVPITGENGVIGEIDIDSDKPAAFSKFDEMFLEAATRQLASYLEKRL